MPAGGHLLREERRRGRRLLRAERGHAAGRPLRRRPCRHPVRADQLPRPGRATARDPRPCRRRSHDRRRRGSRCASTASAPTNVLTKAEFAAAIAEPVTGEHPFVDPEEIAVLLFTSGTTSEPKAAILRHRHLVSYIISSVEFLGCEPTEAQLICVPLVPHRRDRSGAELALRGTPHHVPAGLRSQLDGCSSPPTSSVTHAMVVPTMLGRILNAIEESGDRAPGAAPPLLRRRAHAARAGRAHADATCPTSTWSTPTG